MMVDRLTTSIDATGREGGSRMEGTMSMSKALLDIEQTIGRLSNLIDGDPEEFRRAFQESNIAHDMRWLSPHMEFTGALSTIEMLHVLPRWTEQEGFVAGLCIDAIELFLEGARLGWYAHKQVCVSE